MIQLGGVWFTSSLDGVSPVSCQVYCVTLPCDVSVWLRGVQFRCHGVLQVLMKTPVPESLKMVTTALQCTTATPADSTLTPILADHERRLSVLVYIVVNQSKEVR